MKKLVSLVLALVMIMGLATTAFAADATLEAQNTSATSAVNGKYEGGFANPEVVSVDIFWGAMNFTYTESGATTWDPATHTYIDTTKTEWTYDDNSVKVTNHSNIDVTVEFAFAAEEGFEEVKASFDVASDVLTAGVVEAYDDADSVTSKLTLSGSLDKSVTDFTKIGSITVTIK